MKSYLNPGKLLANLLILSVFGCLIASASTYAYQSYKSTENRKEMAMELLSVAHKQHQWRKLNVEFASSSELSLFPATSAYTLSVNYPKGKKNSFVLLAMPKQGTTQSYDLRCQGLTIDHNYRKGITGIGPIEKCWQI